MRAWLHWLVRRTVPQIYLRLWRRRKYFWLQIITHPAADQTVMFDEMHRGPKVIPVAGLRSNKAFFFLVGHHDTVTEALRNPDLQSFSKRHKGFPRWIEWAEKVTRPKGWGLHPLAPPAINAIDGPDHQRLRTALSGGFAANRIADWSDDIEHRVALLLDEMEKLTTVPGNNACSSTVDLMAGFCRELPAIMIGSIFGLSADQVRELDYWRQFDSALTALDVDLSWSAYQQDSAALARLLSWIAEQLRDGPREGLPQVLARNNNLNDDERIVTCALMLEAGFVTTVSLLANGIRLLLDHPDQLELLRAHPQLWANAVEEILRIEPPLRFNSRIAVRDTTLAGQEIKKGKIIALSMAAANRDPAVFPDPHTFDVTRSNARQHLSFSAGRHYCIGPALARAEALIALPAFFERFKGATLAARPVRANYQVMQKWTELLVTLRTHVYPERSGL